MLKVLGHSRVSIGTSIGAVVKKRNRAFAIIGQINSNLSLLDVIPRPSVPTDLNLEGSDFW
jgi:hypothetical protein